MRISDWSSDVCSSDLILVSLGGFGVRATWRSGGLFLLVNGLAMLHGDLRQRFGLALHFLDIIAFHGRLRSGKDRKRAAQGKSVSVLVALGGRRSMKKKNNRQLLIIALVKSYTP